MFRIPAFAEIFVDRIELHDVGFFGGYDLYVVDGKTVYLRFVTPGATAGYAEDRRKISIPEVMQRKIQAVFHVSNFSDLTSHSARSPVPEEITIVISARQKDGKVHTVEKLANDLQPRFDLVLRELNLLLKLKDKGTALYNGHVDWTWRPDEF